MLTLFDLPDAQAPAWKPEDNGLPTGEEAADDYGALRDYFQGALQGRDEIDHQNTIIDALIAKNSDGAPMTDEQGYVVFKPGVPDGDYANQLAQRNKAVQTLNKETSLAAQAEATPSTDREDATMMAGPGPGPGKVGTGPQGSTSKLYAMAGMSDSQPFASEPENPFAADDPFSIWRRVFTGQDNPEVANTQWADIMNKKVLPGLASWGKATTKILGPAGAPFAFGLEVEKNMFKNYDNPQYGLIQGIVDAAKTEGFELGADYSAKGISTALAKAFKLSEPVRTGLENSLSQSLTTVGEEAIEKGKQEK
ncbi:MAG: hypothetical protein P4N41_25730 [Negativicutes bacterium]|nr:hypothetical protein [Negativicutes bacterium]MDR3593076.1 hypothetical protein [Negativicutes bacterium]